jgi:beta-N-acetylhexosaminidase
LTDSVLSNLADSVLVPPFAGPAAPAWFLAALERGLAGVTFFASNVDGGPASVASLTASLRAAGPDPLIAIDEEGGDVTRVWYDTGSPYPGNAALGAVDDTRLTEDVYAEIGAALAGLGINLNLAPCLDVLSAPRNPVIGTRSFGSSPSLVARHGAAAVRGLQSAGVAACAKHFPGHGSTLLDSHLELAEVTGDAAVVAARDLPPFRAAIEARALTAMPGHLRVPWLTGSLPASLSAEAMALLRGELGFSGVVVTDGLEMRAVSRPYGLPGASVRALTAGCDLLCLGRDQTEEDYLAVRAAIVDAVRAGDLPGPRLEEASARVRTLRVELGALRLRAAARAASGLREPRSGATGAFGSTVPAGAAEGSRLGLEAARRALRLTGPRPVLRDPVVVEVEPVLNMAAGQAHWGLTGWVPPAGLRRVAAADPEAAREAMREALKAAADRGLIVAFRDAHRSPATRDFVTALLAERPDAVLLEMGLPYWMPPAGAGQAHLATYGASRASTRAAAEVLGLSPSHLIPFLSITGHSDSP